jgi:hypothetical protein
MQGELFDPSELTDVISEPVGVTPLTTCSACHR